MNNSESSVLENASTTQFVKSEFVSADAPVSKASLFAHGLWQMESLVTLAGCSPNQFHWDFKKCAGFPGGFALSLAEYTYARLYKPVESRDRIVSWLSIRNELFVLQRFANYCHKNSYSDFSYIDHFVLGQYWRELKSDKTSDSQIREIFSCIYRLWEFGPRITKGISSIPFGARFEKIFGKSAPSSRENKTPRIPDAIYKPLIKTALNYVLYRSKPILMAWNAIKEIYSLERKPNRQVYRIQKFLADVPSDWRNKQWNCFADLASELQQLRVACTIVTFMFSGVRSSELLSIEFHPIVVDVDEDGHVLHYLNTTLHKHKKGGRRDTWVVIDEVVKAIEIMESLTEHIRIATGEQRLFITDGTSHFFSPTRIFKESEITELTSPALVWQINRFAQYTNSHLNDEKIPGWPDDSGEIVPWRFNSMQFRRTLAQYIAREPFGIIAGMLQYKHVSSVMFEGYAGEEPEWNKILETEEVLASIDIMDELAIDLAHGEIAGEYGEALKSQFEVEFRGRAEDYPPSQIARWLSDKNKSLHVAKFNLCFFDPTKALCTTSSSKKNIPVTNSCDPKRCGNSCVSTRHRPLWEAQLAQVQNLLDAPKISKYQKIILNQEAADLEDVINELRRS